MPLDAAQFISELSVTDPPGTDPLNQGDDHIRTTKLAVQQSFPNVGSAVPQTGAQMAQMAIKNEANTFTQTNEFQARQDFNNIRFLFGVGATRGAQWNNIDTGFKVWDLVANSASSFLNLRRFDSLGVQQENPISLDPATGNIELNNRVSFIGASAPRHQPPTADDVSAFILQDETPANRWQIRRKSSNDAQPNTFVIQQRDAGGAFVADRMQIFDSGSVLFKTDFLVIQRSTPGASTQLVFQNETTNRWMWRFSGATGRMELVFLNTSGVEQGTAIEVRLSDGAIFMPNLPTGPTATSKEIYAKQSQTFAGTELVLGQTP